MDLLSSREIRDKFLEFFQSKDHLLIENASIIPKNDPTLLFINSGMAPIKKFFTGEEKPKYPRLCNIQPCIRTIDIDEIGDKHHLTSFQMLGSWSINNYFKEKAIPLAFEFLTKHLNIPKEKLYATVFSGDKSIGLKEDSEAREYWEKAGMPKDHIVACGKEDNFWGPTSDTGPCGPCTEVFYDTGKGKEYVKGGEFDTKERYIEIWNAGVFMQFNKNADGTYSRLNFTSVDTGAGLERLSMVLNGHESVYDTDMLSPIKNCIENSIKCGGLSERSLRILTDHLRTVSLILSEDVKPSNEGRGYIPRKLIRKCVMIIKKNKIEGFDFNSVLRFVINKYSELYPDFVEKQGVILSEFDKEKVQFEKVLGNGIHMLEEIKDKSKTISGEEAFELVTTYGIPFDIIVDYAVDSGMEVDEDEFKKKLENHKKISKKPVGGSEIGADLDLEEYSNYDATKFVGYDMSKTDAQILYFKVQGEKVSDSAEIGDKVVVILDKSCMYAESGGQISDKGFIIGNNFKIRVDSVKKNKVGVFLHFGTLESVGGAIGGKVSVTIDELRRKRLANNHSAVHLLHSALRNIFGKDLHQSGSKVEEHGLRFDFNYDKPIDENKIFEIEKLVNSYITENLKQVTEIKPLSEAINEGAIALFESKYTNDVRVVSFGDVSKELCGGTHTTMTGNIGLFCVDSVESIGKGIKRIVALTGQDALGYVQGNRAVLKNICTLVRVQPDRVEEKIESILNATGKSSKSADKFDINDVKLVDIKGGIKGGYVIKHDFDKTFNELSIDVADKIGGVFLCISGTEKKRLLLAVSNKLKGKIKAKELINKLFTLIDGKGGGNDRIASGGTSVESKKIIAAFENL